MNINEAKKHNISRKITIAAAIVLMLVLIPTIASAISNKVAPAQNQKTTKTDLPEKTIFSLVDFPRSLGEGEPQVFDATTPDPSYKGTQQITAYGKFTGMVDGMMYPWIIDGEGHLVPFSSEIHSSSIKIPKPDNGLIKSVSINFYTNSDEGEGKTFAISDTGFDTILNEVNVLKDSEINTITFNLEAYDNTNDLYIGLFNSTDLELRLTAVGVTYVSNNYNLSGTVYDKEKAIPLSGATVGFYSNKKHKLSSPIIRAEEFDYQTTTNAEGAYSLDIPSSTTGTLVFMKDGFVSDIYNVTQPVDTQVPNVELSRAGENISVIGGEGHSTFIANYYQAGQLVQENVEVPAWEMYRLPQGSKVIIDEEGYLTYIYVEDGTEYKIVAKPSGLENYQLASWTVDGEELTLGQSKTIEIGSDAPKQINEVAHSLQANYVFVYVPPSPDPEPLEPEVVEWPNADALFSIAETGDNFGLFMLAAFMYFLATAGILVSKK